MCLLVVLLQQCRSILCLHLWTHFHFGVSVENHYRCYGFFGRPYASRICSIFPLCMESKALVKSTNSNVAWRFFARTPSRILRMVSICEVVDLFLGSHFGFSLRMLSILGSMRFLETGDYFLCIYVVVCHERRVVRKYEHTYQNAYWFFCADLFEWHWRVCPWFSLCPDDLREISKIYVRIIERKIKNSVMAKALFCFIPFPTFNDLESFLLSWLIPSFLNARKIRAWRNGHCTLVFAGCFIALSVHSVEVFGYVDKYYAEWHILFNASLQYLL